MTEKFHFQKLEATGNDFILVDARNQDIPLEHLADIGLKICHRKTGIGADGLLILYPDSTMGADYTMIYKNADGSDAGMCGNGGRAIAFYALKMVLRTPTDFKFMTKYMRLLFIQVAIR